MSDDTSASVWNDGGPTLVDVDPSEPTAKKTPPPLPTSTPVVKTSADDITKDVPTGDLIRFESEEEREATLDDIGPAALSALLGPVQPNPDMDNVLREFLKEEATQTPQDYLRRFYQIRVEQEKLRLEPEFKTDTAVAPQHYARNRYRDILPYDHNRVEIHKDSENPEGYMNASFIELPAGKTRFIAAQAPLPATLDEWWSMIDNHKVALIVILCKLVEQNKIKCERYWPENPGETEIFGDYEVTLVEKKTFDDKEYTMRILKMENQSNGESRTIHQLHYKEWPDHGCPSGEKQLLNMIDLMEKLHEELPTPRAPILVHCSAGVGRTGTIIAINYIREQMMARTLYAIDIFNLVIALRKQRASMVQTQDQYQFVHRCIASYCRRLLGIPEPVVEDLSNQLPVGGPSGPVRLIAPPTPTTSDQTGVVNQYQPDPNTNRIVEDDADATSVPDFPEEPPAPKGPEDLGSSAAF